MFCQTYVSTLRGGLARLHFTNRRNNNHYQVNELLNVAYIPFGGVGVSVG